MSDNLYIMYLKHISEGDAAAGQEGAAISPQLKNLINNASSGENGANKCMSFLNKKYGIKDVNSLCNFIKKLFTSAAGAAKNILSKIWSGVQTAIRWALKLIKKSGSINAKEDFDHQKVGRQLAYARALTSQAMAAICGATVSVIGKVIYNGKQHLIVQMNDRDAKPKFRYRGITNSGRNITWNQKFKSGYDKYMRESIMECKAMFSDLDQLIESSHLSEGPEIRKFIDSYIQKMQPKVMELWNNIDTIVRSNKVLAIAVAICSACVFSYMGIKKYSANRKQKKAALA